MGKMYFFTVILISGLFCSVTSAYTPSPENLKNRQWFQDAKFGLFIHWGPYALLGQHEWIMETDKIPVATYERMASFFYPAEFVADEWVALAQQAGMRYITVTAKHHDGFAMYDSQYSQWDIMDHTAYKQDIIKALAIACEKAGIKLFVYYSQLDWHHPDYFPRGETGAATGRPERGQWNQYLDFMNNQLTELLTNYGPLGGIWFDGWWDKKNADWQLDKTYKLIHRLQPGALIGSNHHQAPKPGEDFQMFEKDLPGQNTSGHNADASIGQLPLETAETMAERWGFSLRDTQFKSARVLIHYLVQAAGHNSNFLLNVGPMPNGKIQSEFVSTLEEVGQWLAVHGEAIYGTRGGPFPPQPWGVSTQKGDKVFLHILDWQQEYLLLPKLDRVILEVKLFGEQTPVTFENHDFGTVIRVPTSTATMDTILQIQLQPR